MEKHLTFVNKKFHFSRWKTSFQIFHRKLQAFWLYLKNSIFSPIGFRLYFENVFWKGLSRVWWKNIWHSWTKNLAFRDERQVWISSWNFHRKLQDFWLYLKISIFSPIKFRSYFENIFWKGLCRVWWKTFDICKQKISLFEMKDKFEFLLGISIENCKTFDSN